jgi:drug/metabolite transporter (DMT)-like permease
MGVALAIAGIVIASRTAGDAHHTLAARGDARAGTTFALVAAIGFGCFFVLLHDASTYSVAWATFVQRLTSVSILLVATVVLRPSLTVGWRRAPRLLAIGALDQGANLLYGFASTLGVVSLAAVLASLFPIVTVVLARAVLHERISRTQQTGVACALAGVALIAGG